MIESAHMITTGWVGAPAIFPMQQHKTEINQRIWQVVALIPQGKVATYGDIARHAGLPGAARRVGAALRGLPTDTRIPWHRVINAQGRISLPAKSNSSYLQRERLEAEGVLFSGTAKVDLRRYRWQPG
jgi:methylated-DNA-protein-cysteine methyltransferase related protein